MVLQRLSFVFRKGENTMALEPDDTSPQLSVLTKARGAGYAKEIY
jgi:hypothetical protein